MGRLLVVIGINMKEHLCPLEDWGNGYGLVATAFFFFNQNPKAKRLSSEKTFVL